MSAKTSLPCSLSENSSSRSGILLKAQVGGTTKAVSDAFVRVSLETTTLAAERDSLREQLEGLVEQWYEQADYPPIVEGDFAAAAVRVCARELAAIINPKTGETL